MSEECTTPEHGNTEKHEPEPEPDRLAGLDALKLELMRTRNRRLLMEYLRLQGKAGKEQTR